MVWITKYCKPILTGKIALRTREIIRQVCSRNDVEIISEYAGKDHIHLLVSVPPHLLVSRLVQYLKGNSSYKMQKEFKELNQQYWGRHMWARGYFVVSSGNITDEIIAEYIKNQDIEERANADNFMVNRL
ncbi:MAG: IS200/IS605 family transposase [Oscillospiraceae bacterium]|nr:IS200/IS605 family transposase [Oscillospiraceae bacterium]